MVTLLPRYTQEAKQRKPTFSEIIGLNETAAKFGKGLSESFKAHEEEQELEKKRKAIGEATGINTKGFSEAMLGDVVKNFSSQAFKPPAKQPFDKQLENVANQKYLNDEPLTEQERSYVTPASVRSKRAEGRPTKQTQASQPINEDQLQRMNEVREMPEYETASPSQKYRMLTNNGVSKENAQAERDSYIEEAKIGAEKAKTEAKEKETKEANIRQERQYFDSQTKAFDEKLIDSARAAETQNRALQRQTENIDKISNFDRFVSAVAGSTPYAALLKSKNAQEFDANTLPQLEGLRQVLGGVLSDSDIRLLMQKIVTSDKNPEANKTIARNMMFENQLKINKRNIGAEIKAKNGGYRPPNYADEIEKIYNERHGNDIREMFNEIMSLPDNSKKLSSFRRTVPPGTNLNDDAIKMYYVLAKGDPALATKLAEEDGYDIPK